MKNKGDLLRKAGVILIYAAASVYTAFFVAPVYQDFWSAPLFILGCVLCYAFCAFVHEGGHVLFANRLGFKVVGFSVGALKFDFTSGKKIGFGFSEYAGETDVVPVRGGDLLKRYKAVIFGGLASGFLSVAVIGALYFVFAFNKHIAVLFASFPIAVAWVTINTLPGVVKTSDGSFLKEFGKEENSFALEKYLNILYLLYEGKSFSEIDEKFFDFDGEKSIVCEELLVARLMRAEEEGDEGKIAEIIGRLKSLENRLADTDKE